MSVTSQCGVASTWRACSAGGARCSARGSAVTRDARFATGTSCACASPGPRRRAPPRPAPDLDAAIRVIPGPDLDRFAPDALDTLLSTELRVDPRSDRVGIRLTGPTIRRVGDDLGASSPMVRGAIQVPSSGDPIVLGPDHPTTGGYPVLAVVAVASLGALGARPVGGIVRFVAVR